MCVPLEGGVCAPWRVVCVALGRWCVSPGHPKSAEEASIALSLVYLFYIESLTEPGAHQFGYFGYGDWDRTCTNACLPKASF